MAIADLLPGGLEPIVAEAGAVAAAGTQLGAKTDELTLSPIHVERREDRLLLFTTLHSAEQVFRYRVRAVARGHFAMPPVLAEAMYDPAVHATGPSSFLVIE